MMDRRLPPLIHLLILCAIAAQPLAGAVPGQWGTTDISADAVLLSEDEQVVHGEHRIWWAGPPEIRAQCFKIFASQRSPDTHRALLRSTLDEYDPTVRVLSLGDAVSLITGADAPSLPLSQMPSAPEPLATTTVTATLDEGPPEATWRIDSGPWQSPGSSVSVASGPHLLEWRSVAGWTAPAPRQLDLTGTEHHLAESYLPHRGRWRAEPAATAIPWPDGQVENLLVRESGDLIAIGGFEHIDQVDARRIARWDGAAWQPLGAGLNADSEALAEWRGELYAGGYFTDPAARLARWDGSAWHAVGGGTDAAVRALGIWNDQLVVAGEFTAAGDAAAGHIALWDGTSWHTLAGGADDEIYAVGVSDGDLVVTGAFTRIGGVDAAHVARWDGNRWWPLAKGLDAPGYALALHAGELVVTGDFQNAGDIAAARIARWDGQAWQPLGAGLHLGTQPYGRTLTSWRGLLIAGGNFRAAGDWQCQRIAAWDGSAWHPLGAGLENWVEGLAVHDGQLVAGGWFNHLGAGGPLGIARWRGEPAWWPGERRIRIRTDDTSWHWVPRGSPVALDEGRIDTHDRFSVPSDAAVTLAAEAPPMGEG